MCSEACEFLVQAAGYAGAHVLQNEEVEKRNSRAGQHVISRVRRTVQERMNRFVGCMQSWRRG